MEPYTIGEHVEFIVDIYARIPKWKPGVIIQNTRIVPGSGIEYLVEEQDAYNVRYYRYTPEIRAIVPQGAQ